MPYPAMLKIPFKKFLDPDPDADDFQHLISSSLTIDNIFMNICSVTKLLQINRKTDKRQVRHNNSASF